MTASVGKSKKAVSLDYIETTRAFWQPHTSRTLSHEDARQMAHNLIGFFNVLRDWRLAEKEIGGEERSRPSELSRVNGAASKKDRPHP